MILRRYLTKEVLLSTFAVSTVLLLIMLSSRFVKYLGWAATGELDAAVVMQLILYRVPDFLQLILPLGLFVGLLLTYSRLYLENEMRVLFAAGVSRIQLLIYSLLPILVIAMLVGLLSLWITPMSVMQVNQLFDQQDSRSELDSIIEGRFQPFRNAQGIIYVEKMNKRRQDGEIAGSQRGQQEEMKGVYIFEEGKTQQDNAVQANQVVVYAESGKQEINERGRYLVLERGFRLVENKQDGVFEKITFTRYGQRIETRRHLESRNSRIDAFPSTVLIASNKNEYQAAWQWRLSVLILVPVVALIAIALSKADPRQGRYLKLLPAILIYLVYLVLLNMARDQLAAGKLPASLGLAWVHGLFVIVGLVLFNFEFLRQYFKFEKDKAIVLSPTEMENK